MSSFAKGIAAKWVEMHDDLGQKLGNLRSSGLNAFQGLVLNDGARVQAEDGLGFRNPSGDSCSSSNGDRWRVPGPAAIVGFASVLPGFRQAKAGKTEEAEKEVKSEAERSLRPLKVRASSFSTSKSQQQEQELEQQQEQEQQKHGEKKEKEQKKGSGASSLSSNPTSHKRFSRERLGNATFRAESSDVDHDPDDISRGSPDFETELNVERPFRPPPSPLASDSIRLRPWGGERGAAAEAWGGRRGDEGEREGWGGTPRVPDFVAKASTAAGPVSKEELGRCTWTFLHTLAAQYPDKPSKQQQKDVKELMNLLTRIYPCKFCAEHFVGVIKSNPPKVGSREELEQYMCRIHNVVNRSLNKPEFPCKRVKNRWGSLDCDESACSMDP